jgi:endonuclease YncB( thermonuclease family)
LLVTNRCSHGLNDVRAAGFVLGSAYAADMSLRLVAVAAIAVLILSGGYLRADAAPSPDSGVVAFVSDGDTLTLRDGRRIRLVQIDTPELGSGECYSRAARTALLNLAPLGGRVFLEADAALDKVDRYGRLLRYIRRSRSNVNLKLVRGGAATPYFYGRDRGHYASRLMAAARAAKAAKRGLWGACPGTRLDPYAPATTGKRRGR